MTRRDDAILEASSLRTRNNELLLANSRLDDDLQRMRDKMVGSEEQLRKLEEKISISDITLASQVRA